MTSRVAIHSVSIALLALMSAQPAMAEFAMLVASAESSSVDAKAADTSAASKEASADPAAPAAPQCVLNGVSVGFFAIGETGFCGTVHGQVMEFLGKDFATSDVGFVTQRLPSLRSAPGGLTLETAAPILFYYNKDVSYQTFGLYPGTDSMVNFLTFRETDLGTLSTFVNARLVGRLERDSYGQYFSFSQIDGSAWMGAADQAWVQLAGLRVGIQPSLFGFSRVGYAVTPGYSSILTTPAISYTQRFDHIMGSPYSASLSISAEDPSRREYADGMLARYASPRAPDIVGQTRVGMPGILIHFSGVLHQIRDESADLCCNAPIVSTHGWAASVGGEVRWKWSQLIGDLGGDFYGKVMVSAAGGQGALGYLGIPFMGLDYVASSTGVIQRSPGESLIVSYEHLWMPTLKSSLTFSWFQTYLQSAPETILPWAPPLGFETSVRGSRLQASLETMPAPGLTLGLESAYTWSDANGQYNNLPAAPVVVGFPNLVAYIKKAF